MRTPDLPGVKLQLNCDFNGNSECRCKNNAFRFAWPDVLFSFAQGNAPAAKARLLGSQSWDQSMRTALQTMREKRLQ
jgi:hypothetical protein